VWENVAFALQVIGAPQKRLVRDVPRALETVGLQDKTDSRPHQLSGGERQRVAIARAIVNNPRLLLADEPTGNLDPQTGQDIIDVLRRINQSGTTVMMATHDRAVVDRLKLRVVRLSDGRVSSDEAQGVYHLEDDVLHQPNASASKAAAPPMPQSTLSAPQSTLSPSQIAPAAFAPAVAASDDETTNGNSAIEAEAARPASTDNSMKSVVASSEATLLNSATTKPHLEDARPQSRTRPSVAPAAPPDATGESKRFAAPWLNETAGEAVTRESSSRDSARDKRSVETARDAATHYRALRQMPPGRGARGEKNEDANAGETRESPFESPQRNEAPLGSPENPLVQFEPPARAPRRDS